MIPCLDIKCGFSRTERVDTGLVQCHGLKSERAGDIKFSEYILIGKTNFRVVRVQLPSGIAGSSDLRDSWFDFRSRFYQNEWQADVLGSMCMY